MREPLKGRARDDTPAAGAAAVGRPAGRPFVREVSPAFRRVFDTVEAAEPELPVDAFVPEPADLPPVEPLRVEPNPAHADDRDADAQRIPPPPDGFDAFPTPEDFR